MILEYDGKKPKIGNNVFIAPNATIIGDVELCDGSSIWYGAVLRGDMAPIVIGENSNIQDNCTVHTDSEKPTILGKNVTVGHNAVIHACKIDDNCLIGIGAIILNEAHIKTGSVVAAASLVKERKEVGPFQLVAGVPTEVKKELDEKTITRLELHARHYVELGQEHKKL